MRFTDLYGVQHDHETVRRDLMHLRTATSCPALPPEGHAFWGMLRAAADGLIADFPAHMRQEEAEIFDPLEARHGPGSTAGLRAEHAVLDGLLAALGRAVDASGPAAGAGAWDALRSVATRLDACLQAHLDAEERLLRAMVRLEAAPPGDDGPRGEPA